MEAKSFTADTTSNFIISQQNFKKPKLNLSRPGLFELSQFHTAVLISSSVKSPTNNSLSASEIELNLIKPYIVQSNRTSFVLGEPIFEIMLDFVLYYSLILESPSINKQPM